MPCRPDVLPTCRPLWTPSGYVNFDFSLCSSAISHAPPPYSFQAQSERTKQEMLRLAERVSDLTQQLSQAQSVQAQTGSQHAQTLADLQRQLDASSATLAQRESEHEHQLAEIREEGRTQRDLLEQQLLQREEEFRRQLEDLRQRQEQAVQAKASELLQSNAAWQEKLARQIEAHECERKDREAAAAMLAERHAADLDALRRTMQQQWQDDKAAALSALREELTAKFDKVWGEEKRRLSVFP
jgi:chromosome segregation ATPase